MRLPTLDGARRFYAAGLHPVQAVHSCLWPQCMVLKCPDRRTVPDGSIWSIRQKAQTRLTAQAIEAFVASAPSKTKLRVGIQQNFAPVTAMIKAHPCLKQDFQVSAQRW